MEETSWGIFSICVLHSFFIFTDVSLPGNFWQKSWRNKRHQSYIGLFAKRSSTNVETHKFVQFVENFLWLFIADGTRQTTAGRLFRRWLLQSQTITLRAVCYCVAHGQIRHFRLSPNIQRQMCLLWTSCGARFPSDRTWVADRWGPQAVDMSGAAQVEQHSAVYSCSCVSNSTRECCSTKLCLFLLFFFKVNKPCSEYQLNAFKLGAEKVSLAYGFEQLQLWGEHARWCWDRAPSSDQHSESLMLQQATVNSHTFGKTKAPVDQLSHRKRESSRQRSRAQFCTAQEWSLRAFNLRTNVCGK